jgi:hypothetical protein
MMKIIGCLMLMIPLIVTTAFTFTHLGVSLGVEGLPIDTVAGMYMALAMIMIFEGE